jgi:hypothetical protein
MAETFCTCLSISRDPLCVYHGDVDKVRMTVAETFSAEELERQAERYKRGTNSQHPTRHMLLYAASLAREVETLKAERDQAIAHDRQPYPTADAYERVCEARTRWQARALDSETTIERLTAENQRLKSYEDDDCREAQDNTPSLGPFTRSD